MLEVTGSPKENDLLLLVKQCPKHNNGKEILYTVNKYFKETCDVITKGKRARGRQRQTYLQQFAKIPTTLIQGAYDRQAWKSLLMRQSMSGPDRIQDDDDDNQNGLILIDY